MTPSVALWDVAAGAADVTIRFPSDKEREEARALRKARADRKHPIGVRIPLAENAFLAAEARLGPLPVKDGLWLLRSSAELAVKVDIPIPGPHRIAVRARRVSRDAVPRLLLSAGKSTAALALGGFDWTEPEAPIRLEQGDQVITLKLQDGWAADLDWLEVRPE